MIPAHMHQICAALAIAAGGLYSGGAWYLTFVELPALKAAPVEIAHDQWARSVARTPRYAAFALLAALAALIAGGGRVVSLWSWGALTIFCILPFTTIAVLPMQRHLLVQTDQTEWSAGLRRWAKLHAIRTAIGLAATIMFVCKTPG